jgi:Predicted nucleotide-binding protein containing TIR-like domain
MKPRVFIGSSTEGLEVAENLNIRLSRDCETVLWPGAFAVSQTYIESLEKALSDVEFAVLVVTADDFRDKRGVEGKVPRDNVVFELGLFMGRLGRERTFVVSDSKTKVELPTDLLGINVAEFDSDRRDRNLENAMQPAATKIVRSIRQAPRLTKRPASIPLCDALPDQDALYGAIVSWPVGDGHEIVVHSYRALHQFNADATARPTAASVALRRSPATGVSVR